MIRMTNKLGLRATKHWYYTFMLQSWTQFYRGYRSNDTKVYSDFMSPFENLFSIGMDYKFNCKNFDMSAAISPIAANFKYVDRKISSRHLVSTKANIRNWAMVPISRSNTTGTSSRTSVGTAEYIITRTTAKPSWNGKVLSR